MKHRRQGTQHQNKQHRNPHPSNRHRRQPKSVPFILGTSKIVSMNKPRPIGEILVQTPEPNGQPDHLFQGLVKQYMALSERQRSARHIGSKCRFSIFVEDLTVKRGWRRQPIDDPLLHKGEIVKIERAVAA